MPNLLEMLQTLGELGLRTFWLPLGAWTLVCLPLYGALRLWRETHPFVQYYANLALLLALPLGLLLAAATDVSRFVPWLAHPVTLPAVTGTLVLQLPEGAVLEGTRAGSWSLYHTLGAATLAALGLALWQLTRLLLHAAALARFHRSLPASPAVPAARLTEHLRRQLGIRRRVRTTVTDQPVVPMTFGWRRPVIVLPAALAADPVRLEMTLAHELVHVRRYDYLLQWIEQVIGALFYVHPLVALLRHTTSRYREHACDAAVLARGGFTPKQYAALLYSFLLPSQPPVRFSVGMAETAQHLKERILAMKSYARINRFTHPKLAATLVAVLVLATSATVIVACSDLVGPDKPAGVAEAPPAPPPPPAAMPDGEVFVIVDEMPEIVGGLAALQQNLRYPALAKMAGVEGRVIVQFVVDEQGDVVDPVVVRGVGSGLDEAAIAAVRETKFKPGRQAGEPVKVKLSIPITFKLPESASDAQTNSISDLSSPTFDARTMRLALRRMASKMRSIQNE